MTRTLLRGGRVWQAPGDASRPEVRDVLIDGATVSDISPDLDPDGVDEVIDARSLLILPGLVNGHLHSSEYLVRGRYDGLPFDAWGLYVYPILGADPLPERAVYLRTALAGVESLRFGVTAVIDDVADETVAGRVEMLGQVARAYEDVGLRATCTVNVMDVPMSDSLPFRDEFLTTDLVERIRSVPPRPVAEAVALVREAVARHHRPAGRIRIAIAPCAPQWCSSGLLSAAAELSAEHDLNLHIHVLETREQAVWARDDLGGSPIAALDRLGTIGPRTTIAHGVWLSPEDVELLAVRGAAVAHNPIANLRMGVGLAPFRELRRAGVEVGLGTDGLAVGDTADVLGVAKFTALAHRLSSTDPEEWPGAGEVLECATRGGARCASLSDVAGVLEPGRPADLVAFDLDHPAMQPSADPLTQLVFGDPTRAIRFVMVEGEVVLREGRPTRVDEDELLGELRELMPAIDARQRRIEQRHAEFDEPFRRLHARATGVPLALVRDMTSR